MRVSRRFWLGVLVTAFVLVGMQSSVRGEEHEPMIDSVWIVEIEPGHQAKYEAFIRKLVEAAKKTENPIRFEASQRIAGPDLNTYVFVARAKDWATVDTWNSVPEILAKAYGEKEAAKLVAESGAVTRSVSRHFYMSRPDLSYR